MYCPDFEEFNRLAEGNNKIAVYKEISMVGVNPVGVIIKLGLPGTPFVLLESGKGPTSLSRYSYIGFEPRVTCKTKGYSVEITEAGRTTVTNENPYMAVKKLLDRYKAHRSKGLPEFYGGAMGYFSYDMGRFFEKLPEKASDDLALPESYFMITDKVICFDHISGNIKIIVNVAPQDFKSTEVAYEWAKEQIDIIDRKIKRKINVKNINVKEQAWQRSSSFSCNVSKEQFEGMVTKAKEYIRAGDIFQVNLSLRLGQEVNSEPFYLYRVLREINPSPYMCFIDFGDLQVVGSSPELLIRLRNGYAETRPIAGTRRRGANRNEDLALANELISNAKEKAEHIMLVDLERNDLGRVCAFGTVEVNELMVIEEYSHVMHIVSNVRGKLTPGKDRFDLLRACFPGGTITGAPKIRSMEIIEELEPTRRAIYTGSIGFLGFGGEMEMNISIRSIIIKDNVGYVQAGAGIVADSIPEKEYFESMKKAEALLRAMELANELYDIEEQAQ